MLQLCHACSRHSDDLYEINGWLICSECSRTRRFWEMLRDSWSSEQAPQAPVAS